jgi:hypothetical protein
MTIAPISVKRLCWTAAGLSALSLLAHCVPPVLAELVNEVQHETFFPEAFSPNWAGSLMQILFNCLVIVFFALLPFLALVVQYDLRSRDDDAPPWEHVVAIGVSAVIGLLMALAFAVGSRLTAGNPGAVVLGAVLQPVLTLPLILLTYLVVWLPARRVAQRRRHSGLPLPWIAVGRQPPRPLAGALPTVGAPRWFRLSGAAVVGVVVGLALFLDLRERTLAYELYGVVEQIRYGFITGDLPAVQRYCAGTCKVEELVQRDPGLAGAPCLREELLRPLPLGSLHVDRADREMWLLQVRGRGGEERWYTFAHERDGWRLIRGSAAFMNVVFR